ncbi:hypothetical protein [Sinanaerobacter chloroacetimidivorans]|uniref:Uncharacterized protein n=1 Tax=Sinanaerobacter chloroacetimidivorans TaxID=2818044 RepID=A0A8J7W562_9FIRM|nr:hypothetical protein [Sinanaerobacter chloroacetimidivorans]MBR0599385.1 hypothetical protein [Sinanaerobacter chloroacetimidivorans]
MSIRLTPRMSNWISENGVHIAAATKNGFPTVVVTDSSTVEGETITVSLKPSQIKQIENILAENDYVAAAPGQLGSVRAPYQFKGAAKLQRDKLLITVEEIYCTKPGAEAGIRLDTLGYEKMKEYEESRWTDLSPAING